ncbi:prenyltransferase/squalene oxidase repeat-containing protein [Nocardia tengchongensis]|uniref:prenyltransferase/squalene oxidase repeat-containing protein n=1 Tax=Nocardia tengchongensis TaxID=2055889 RepID=UPI003698CA91
MSNMEERINAAIGWLERGQLSDGQGGAGWGWVADVPPNPGNTAEVVCALARAGHDIPQADQVLALVRRETVGRDEHGDWAFRAPIDLSWRLRALRCLGVGAAETDAVDCRDALIGVRDLDSGGWRMAHGVGPISVTATAGAVQALSAIAMVDEAAGRAASEGTRFLVESMIKQDPRVQPMYACAYVAGALARPEIAAIGGKRVERARDLAVQRMLAGLRDGEPGVEEEPFRRENVADTWRHLTLHLSVGALLIAEPRTIFDPAVRAALTHLLDLQEIEPLRAQQGGFRTSPEGFVTSYATTQALEAMVGARQVVSEYVNPARVFDMICREEGNHHEDAQQIVTVRGRTVVMNSLAGAMEVAIGVPAGLTISLFAVGFADDLGKVGSRALLVWGMLFVAAATLIGLTTRLPHVSKRRIAALVFAASTAVVLPIVSFLLT